MAKTRERILVVDDTASTRYMVVRALKQEGFVVTEAATGHDALDRLAEGHDLVVLDVQLPDISGFDISEKIRANPDLAGLPIVHASATNISSDDQAHGLNLGADAYLVHPIDPTVLVATVRALLRMRKAEQDLRKTLTEQSAILKSLHLERVIREQFVATLTHDLRSPLTAARMCAQLIARKSNNPEHVQRQSSRVIENIDRVDEMIQNLLDVNRIRAGEKLPLQPESFELSDCLSSIIDNLVTVHGDRFRLQCDKSIAVFWDPSGLRRTIENLCNNAIKYGAAHTPVTVVVAQKDALVQIEVTNQGKVLTEGEQAVLFNPYARTQSAKESGQSGWGLGLTLVKGFAEAHLGKVEVMSNAAKGTAFTLTLPKDLRLVDETKSGTV